MNHLVLLPVALPLVTGALLVMLGRIGARTTVAISATSTFALLALAIGLALRADDGAVQVYLLGNWAAPWGITLALDRLAALMLVLTAVVGCAALLYALGGEDKQSPHFHALLQFQLMGLNGAFLTADLFNLFVFFEVLLAASYGLLLHGGSAGRGARLKAGVHYVVFNLAGSALFLVAVSMLYGLTGTLNMADMALKLPQLGAESARLAQAAALLLLVVFAVKAALLPLYFWLPDAYAGATAPVAAFFAIMTKVGVYAIARTTTLLFGATGDTAGVAMPALPVLALATLVLAALGALAAQRLRLLAAYLVVASAGTLLLALGLGTQASVAAALFYMVHSTIVAACMFLLVDQIALARGAADRLTAAPMSGGWAPLGIGFFVLAIAAAGAPPLAGFFGKAMVLQAAGAGPMAAWVVALVLGSSLALMVALARAGSVVFWEGATGGNEGPPHRSSMNQRIAIGAMLAATVGCTLAAGPIAAYTSAAAHQLFERNGYIRTVLSAKPAPPMADIRREMRERGQAK
jgi:multicomponent K+:H+ antiporter subunit D